MQKVNITFRGFPSICLQLDDNNTVKKLLKILKASNTVQEPISRDQKKYSLQYLQKLAIDAKENLGWDWIQDTYSYEQTIRLHKDIEQLAGPDFLSVPKEFHELIHEIHYCLHAVEQGQKRGNFIQVEWFNSLKVPLDENFTHKKSINFGDVRLQNPYVGHTPLMMWIQKDNLNIDQTCKFHDRITPGLYISIEQTKYDYEDYRNWWETHAQDFVSKHGWEKIWHYTGHPVVGHVSNLKDLEEIATTDEILSLESISFN